MNVNARTLFRVVAIAEALSWLGLLIGMYFKWVAKTSEVGVQVFGPIHGAVFVAYCLVVLAVRRPLQWDLRTFLLAGASAVPPFATVVFDWWAERTGRLDGDAVLGARSTA